MTPEQKAAAEDEKLWQEVRNLLVAHGPKGVLDAIATVTEEYWQSYSQFDDTLASYWNSVTDSVDDCANSLHDPERVAVVDDNGQLIEVFAGDDGDSICDAVERGYDIVPLYSFHPGKQEGDRK